MVGPLQNGHILPAALIVSAQSKQTLAWDASVKMSREISGFARALADFDSAEAV
jgi:hypothetical protein